MAARRGPGRGGERLALEFEGDALDPGGPADAGRGPAAELLDQGVVAAAAADGALGALLLRLELEHGAGVVVEAAHPAGVDLVGDAEIVEVGAQAREVLRAGVAEMVGEGGRPGDHRLAALLLAVQEPQGGALVAALAVVAD